MIDMNIPIFHRDDYLNVIFDSRNLNSNQSLSKAITEGDDKNCKMGIQIDKAGYLLPDMVLITITIKQSLLTNVDTYFQIELMSILKQTFSLKWIH